jgi:hypothetical protein
VLGVEADPFYFFSITHATLEQGPWREGMIYILPAGTFEREPPITTGGIEVRTSQMASPSWRQIRVHDEAVTIARATANPAGFPWSDPE